MKRRWSRNLWIEILAYAYRYVYLILIGTMPIWLRKDYLLAAMGVGAIWYAAYGLIGYICRWKHIYCAFQSMYRQNMTPDDIRWHKIKKRDAYGSPAIFGVLGIGLLIAHYYVTASRM